jgi:hypothetical protein
MDPIVVFLSSWFEGDARGHKPHKFEAAGVGSPIERKIPGQERSKLKNAVRHLESTETLGISAVACALDSP